VGLRLAFKVVMENINISLNKWLLAITFIGATKQGFTYNSNDRWSFLANSPLDLYHTYPPEGRNKTDYGQKKG